MKYKTLFLAPNYYLFFYNSTDFLYQVLFPVNEIECVHYHRS